MSGPSLGGRGTRLGPAVRLKSASKSVELRRHRGSFGIGAKSARLRRSAVLGRRRLTTQWSRRRAYHRVKDLTNEARRGSARTLGIRERLGCLDDDRIGKCSRT